LAGLWAGDLLASPPPSPVTYPSRTTAIRIGPISFQVPGFPGRTQVQQVAVLTTASELDPPVDGRPITVAPRCDLYLDAWNGHFMESDLWRGFAAVAATGSFTAASEVLPISQSGLSQQVRRLESLLGVALFDRNSGGVALSKTGERLLPLVRDLIGAEDHVLSFARRIAGEHVPVTVRVFVAEDGTGSLLIDMIDEMRATVDDIRFEVNQISIASQAGSLSSAGTIEALIERTPSERSVGSGSRTMLRAEPMCVVVPADVEIADEISVAEASLLDLRPMSWLPDEWTQWLPLFHGDGDGGGNGDTVLVVNSFRTAIQSVPLDRRSCIAPISIAETMVDVGCKIIRLSDAPIASLDLVTVTEHPVLVLLHKVAAIVSGSPTRRFASTPAESA